MNNIPPKKRAKKEEAQLLAAVDASTMPSSKGAGSTPIIDEASPKNKGIDKKKTKNLGGLTMESSVPDLSIKVYEEQIDGGLPALRERILALDKSEYWAFAIVHDKDEVEDSIFEPALKKPHVHVPILRVKRTAGNRIDRRKVSTFLKLLGITFRPGLDDELWKQRGVERIHDLAKSVAYLTHETKEADLAGKHVYERSEIISNLDPAEIDQLREGYTRINAVAHKADLATQAELAELAYKVGYTGAQSWSEFEKSLPFMLQKGSSQVFYRRRYAEGLAKKVEENRSLVRLAIFIEGPKDLGKTTGALRAIEKMGLSCYSVSDGGKTGRWDRLTPSHDALLIDDAVVHDVLGLADNKVCEVYRRGGENPYFCGKLLVVCSNLPFNDWLKVCNVPDRQIEAARSRFYICRATEKNGEPALVLDSYSTRGTTAEQSKRMDMFLKFAKPMEASMREYKAIKKEQVDYSPLDAYREIAPQQMTIREFAPRPTRKLHYRDPDTLEIYDDIDKTDVRKIYEEGYIEGGVFVKVGHTIALLDDEDEPLPFG